MTGAAADLREMLAQGWEVAGFQSSITQLERSSETDGYTILLRRGPDLAIATVMYTDEGLQVDQIHYLTKFRD
jgi:hypothetical protein